MENVLKTIYGLDKDQLNQIVAAVKQRRDQLHTQQAQSLQVGDVVTFTGRRGRTITGTVCKVKIKYVHVDCGADGKWNVPGAQLTRKVAE